MVNKSITGVILAGGKSRRMGRDKSWVELNEKSMIETVLDVVLPQVSKLIINANSNDPAYANLGYDIASDSQTGHLGPLAGILTGMENAHDAEIIFTTSVDCPLLPHDIVAKLLVHMADDIDIVRVRSNGRHHPVIALWKTHLREALKRAIVDKGVRKVDDFTKDYTIVDVDFDNEGADVFFNINKQDDIDTYTKIK